MNEPTQSLSTRSRTCSDSDYVQLVAVSQRLKEWQGPSLGHSDGPCGLLHADYSHSDLYIPVIL